MAKRSGKAVPGRITRPIDVRLPKTSVNRIRSFDPRAFLDHAGLGRTIVNLKKKQTIFSQGDPAEAVFYIQQGQVKLSVISSTGKEPPLPYWARETLWERSASPTPRRCAWPRPRR